MKLLELAKEIETMVDLLARAAEFFEEAGPDSKWFHDYFLLTGDHMILLDDGWCSGECKNDILKSYPNEKEEDIILDEVNAP